MGNKFSMKQLLNDKSTPANSGPKAAFPLQTIDIDSIIPNERNFFSVEDVQFLKDSIQMNGLEQNLVVSKDPTQNKYVIISGHRRWKALRLLVDEGHDEFRAIPCKVSVAESVVDDIKTELRLIFGNATTRILTNYEKTQQVIRMKELLMELKRNGEKIPGRLRDLIADTLQTSPSKVSRMENIAGNLAPEFQSEFKAGGINISVANALSGLPQEKQREAYEGYQKKGTITVNDVKQHKTTIKVDKPPASTAHDCSKKECAPPYGDKDDCEFHNNNACTAAMPPAPTESAPEEPPTKTRCVDEAICPACGVKFDPSMHMDDWNILTGTEKTIQCPDCKAELTIYASIEWTCNLESEGKPNG